MTALPSTSVQLAPNLQQAKQRNSIPERYSDAYLKANFQTTRGGSVKTLSLIIGGAVAGLAFLYVLATTNIIRAALGFFAAIIGAATRGTKPPQCHDKHSSPPYTAGRGTMQYFGKSVLAVSLLVAVSHAQKTYNHASEYQVAVLDETAKISTGADATLGKTRTDAKLNGGGQGFHFLHTDHGNYRVEAPVNKGMSFMSALAAPQGTTPVTYHNKWFLDNVAAGTNVLFAAQCSKPNKKHPNDVVRCEFWFPDPDSTSHEYRTLGDFTPYLEGDGSNIQKTANSLCGTGKLNPETEKKVCTAASTVPATEQAEPAK